MPVAPRAFVRGRRMKKRWSFLPAVSVLLASDQTALASGGFTPTEAVTIIRMLGSYVITPAGTVVADTGTSIGIGIGVVSADAFSAGAGSMPDPLGEPDYPWLFWKNHAQTPSVLPAYKTS